MYMPTKGTVTMTVRVREDIADAIAAEAKRRRITRNKVVGLFLDDRFSHGADSQKSDEIGA